MELVEKTSKTLPGIGGGKTEKLIDEKPFIQWGKKENQKIELIFLAPGDIMRKSSRI